MRADLGTRALSRHIGRLFCQVAAADPPRQRHLRTRVLGSRTEFRRPSEPSPHPADLKHISQPSFRNFQYWKSMKHYDMEFFGAYKQASLRKRKTCGTCRKHSGRVGSMGTSAYRIEVYHGPQPGTDVPPAGNGNLLFGQVVGSDSTIRKTLGSSISDCGKGSCTSRIFDVITARFAKSTTQIVYSQGKIGL
jgi:hypothetical protein